MLKLMAGTKTQIIFKYLTKIEFIFCFVPEKKCSLSTHLTSYFDTKPAKWYTTREITILISVYLQREKGQKKACMNFSMTQDFDQQNKQDSFFFLSPKFCVD